MGQELAWNWVSLGNAGHIKWLEYYIKSHQTYQEIHTILQTPFKWSANCCNVATKGSTHIPSWLHFNFLQLTSQIYPALFSHRVRWLVEALPIMPSPANGAQESRSKSLLDIHPTSFLANSSRTIRQRLTSHLKTNWNSYVERVVAGRLRERVGVESRHSEKGCVLFCPLWSGEGTTNSSLSFCLSRLSNHFLEWKFRAQAHWGSSTMTCITVDGRSTLVRLRAPPVGFSSVMQR